MKKPWLIRLIGWAGWVPFLLLAFTVWQFKNLPQTPGLLMMLVFFAGCTIACWTVWALASAVVWIMRKQAATTAAMLRDGGRPAASEYRPRVEAMNARLYCVTHQRWVPMAHLAGHDTRDCLYVPDLPSRFPPKEAPGNVEPFMTSPLGLNQKP